MELETFIDNFELLAEAPNGVQKLREMVLQLAVQGKLVPQDPQDEPASVLLDKIASEKERLAKEGKIKKAKPLPAIEDGEARYELPIGWGWVRLGNLILSITGGGTPSKRNPSYWEGKIPWASVKDLNKSKYLEKTVDYITEDGLINSSSNLIPKGRIIICTRMGLGKIAITSIEVAINQDLKALWLPDAIDIDYFYNFYRTQNIVGSGMTVSGIRQEELFKMLIPIPPLNEQKRIVAKVDELMVLCDELEERKQNAAINCIRFNEASLQRLMRATEANKFNRRWQKICDSFDILYSRPENVVKLRQAILQLAVQGKLVPQEPKDEPASVLLEKIAAEKERLVKEGKIQKDKKLSPLSKDNPPWMIPDSWCWVRLQDIFEISRGGSPRPAGDPLYFGGDIPWITVREITKDANIFLTGTENGLTKLGSKKSRFIYPEDMLITNSGATLGVPKISKIEGCINDGVALLRMFHSNLDSFYAYHFLFQQTESFRSVNQGMGQPNLNTPILAGWYFPLPPLNEQTRIVAKVDELMALCDELEASLSQSQTDCNRLMESAVERIMAA